MSTPTIIAQKVDDFARLQVLPKHFGRLMIHVEHGIFSALERLARNYRGALWDFYELSNGGFYMAPQLAPLTIAVDGNGFEGVLSADAAGITACLFAFGHLSFVHSDSTIAEHYYRLRDYALEHAEHSEIFAAID